MNESRVIKTACGLCLWACGMNVHLNQENEIVRISGMKEHPLNKGALCPKTGILLDYLFSKDRLKYPMRKEKSGWKKISWEDVLDLITEKLMKAKETLGAKSLAVCIGMPIAGVLTYHLLRRFTDAFGTPNVFSPDSMCYRTRMIGYISTLGKFPVADPEESNCIILWGSDPKNSNPSLARRIQEAKNRGAKLIVIDPRRTFFSKEADFSIQPKPGSDCAVALGLINLILRKKFYEKDFIEKWTVGFKKLEEHLRSFLLEDVEKITWVKTEDMEKIAEFYGLIKPACIIQGTNGLDQTASGVQTARAIAILQALTGNIDVAGGLIATSRIKLAPLRLLEKLEEKPIETEKHPLFYEIWGRLLAGEARTPVFSDIVLTEKPYPIRSAMILASNPVLTWPNSRKVVAALSKLDFVVVKDLYMTETAEFADVILPSATFMERTELCDYYGVMCGVPYIMLRKKILEMWECKSDIEFLIGLGKRLCGQTYFPWENTEELIDYSVRPSRLSLKDLMENPSGIHFGSKKIGEYRKLGFNTPSGKIELYSETLRQYGYSPLPTPIGTEQISLSEKEEGEDYPLFLITGCRNLKYTHSQFRNLLKSKKRGTGENVAEVHPDTLKEHKIADGEMISVETKIGKIEIRVQANKDIHEKVVSISHGWGESNVNILTDDRPSDPISGFPSLKGSMCKIGSLRRNPSIFSDENEKDRICSS